MQLLPQDSTRWTTRYVSPAKDFILREEVKDEMAAKLVLGTAHPLVSRYPGFRLVALQPAQEGSQAAYYCADREHQWEYNLEHASTTGDALAVLRYTWVVPRAEYLTDGRVSVEVIPSGQMPTWGGAYTWRFVGERMQRFNDELDGLFVQVTHEYWDTEHPLRSEEIDRTTGRRNTVTREVVAANTVGHEIDVDGNVATYESINEHCGWLTTRKAAGLAGNLVNGKAVRVQRGVKPHYWPKVLDYIAVMPVYSDPRDIFSEITGYNVARKFKCEDYNDECTITIVETVTTKEPIFGGDPLWTASSPSNVSPEIPKPTPMLTSGIRFQGTSLTVNCEDCLRQGYEFYDNGWKEFFPATQFTNWPESRLANVDVRMEDGVWITECLFVDSPAIGRSSGLDLLQRSAALPTSVEVRWTPQTEAGALHVVRIDVATSGDFTRGFLTGFRNKVVTPATNSPVDSYTTITGMVRGAVYYVRLTRTAPAPSGAVTVSNTLVVTGRASPELTWQRAGNAVASGSTVAFGPVEVGETGRITVSLASIGLVTVSEIEARLSGAGELVFGHDLPPAALNPGLTQALELRFSPTALGDLSATLTVTSDAPDSPHTLVLTGTGAAPEITLEQPAGTGLANNGTVSFGTVTTGTVSKTFRLRNTGNAPLRNVSASLAGADNADFTFTTPLTVTEIAAGGAADFTIQFDPVEREDAFGTRTVVLTIANNDADENPTLITLTGVSQSPTAPGALEATFNPNANGVVRALVTRADGKILIAGDFTMIGATARNRIALLNADGTLDSGFNPDANGVVRCVLVQPDGAVLIVGDFTLIGATARNRIALLNADGTLNSWYPTGGCDGSILCLARKGDGAVWIGGPFSTVGGVTRKRIALINADATINAANPSVALGISIPAVADVRSLVLDATERVVISGYYFATLGWGFVARLLANGDVDTSFIGQVYFNGAVNAVAVLADGRVVAGGSFTTMSTVTGTFPSISPGSPVLSRGNLIVLNSAGVPTADVLDANGEVHVLAVQANSRVHVGGAFTTLAGEARLRVARMLNDMRLEAAWDPQAGGAVRAIFQQDNGLVLMGGDFTTVAGTGRNYAARVQNNEALSTLTVVDASLITWQRAGALAETLRVLWQVDTGSGYGTLAGVTSLTSGGWQLVPTTPLSGTGTVRALALPNDGHSSGMQQALRTFDFSPEIVVEIGGVDTASGSTLAFGDVQTGVTSERQVTIRNAGLTTLTISSLAITGTAAARYTKVDPLLSIAPGTSSVCTVRFLPTTLGSQPAVLTITNNDSNEGSFVINLSGTGTLGPGGVDSSWQPTVTGTVNVLAIPTATELVAGGNVTAINAQASRRWGRINLVTGAALPESGALVTQNILFAVPDLRGGIVLFCQSPNNTLQTVALTYRSVAGVQDSTFKITWPAGLFYAAALLPDGSILVSTGPSGLRRITPAGVIDPNWANPYNSLGSMSHIAVLPNGAYYLGLFRTSGTIVVRCLPNGAIDSTFNAEFPNPTSLRGLETCADGGVMAFYATGSEMKIKKLLPSGAVDTTFADRTWTTLPSATSAQMQADGSMILSAGVSGAISLCRLLPSSADDPTWNGPAGYYPAMTQDDSGRVYYATTGAIRRLINNAPTSLLSVNSASRVTWLRGGSLPEVSWVRLDLSEDGGSTYQHLGLCTRMTGGWERTGLSLPRNGRVRVQAYTGSALITAEQNYTNLTVPDLVIERSNVVQAEGAVVTFAGRQVGQTSEVTLTLRNTGTAELTSLVAAVSASDFSLVSLGLPGQADPTRLAPLQETQLVLRFTPTLTGLRNGTLTVTSNVPGAKGRMTLNLSGNGVTNPATTTQAATGITNVAARLNGAFTANDDTATLSFQYKRNIDTVWTTITLDPASGFVSTSRFADIGGLTPNTLYNIKTVITNSLRTQEGLPRSFTTLT